MYWLDFRLIPVYEQLRPFSITHDTVIFLTLITDLMKGNKYKHLQFWMKGRTFNQWYIKNITETVLLWDEQLHQPGHLIIILSTLQKFFDMNEWTFYLYFSSILIRFAANQNFMWTSYTFIKKKRGSYIQR